MKKHFFFFFFFVLLFSSCKKETINNNNSFGRGVQKTPNYSTLPKTTSPSGSSSGLPSKYDLSHLMPEVRNQGKQGSCVAFCLSYLKSYQEKVETGLNYSNSTIIMSPAFIYNQLNKNSNSCMTAGLYTEEALKHISWNGICNESKFPYDENDCSKQPSQSAIQSAYNYAIRDWGRFNMSNRNTEIDIKWFISNDYPIIVAGYLDEDFETNFWNVNGRIWKINNTNNTERHCMLVVGFDDNKNAFKVLNSWGFDFADQGYIWIDYDKFFSAFDEAHVTWDKQNVTSSTYCNGFNWTGGPLSQCGSGYEISKHITGGTAPYTFYVNNQQIKSGVETGFLYCVSQKGTYIIKCIDGKGCELTTTKIIN